MLSNSPLLSLHKTCCVASPPIPKLRAWRGEKSSRHTYTYIRSNVQQVWSYTVAEHAWSWARNKSPAMKHKASLVFLPQTGAWAEQESPPQRAHQALCLYCRIQNGCAAEKQIQQTTYGNDFHKQKNNFICEWSMINVDLDSLLLLKMTPTS